MVNKEKLRAFRWLYILVIVAFAVLFWVSFDWQKMKYYGVAFVSAYVISYVVFFVIWAILSWIAWKKLQCA